ncbi:MAG: hypothetical protein LC659_10435 [Myxococcales bacterium]|nr:hypothetical protein [Myxococcales bacterium]
MTVSETDASNDLRRLALDKMSAVLGPVRARQLLESIVADLRIELRTPDDLFRFSDALSKMGGFEGAVGAMLGVAAVIRGASPVSRSTV